MKHKLIIKVAGATNTDKSHIIKLFSDALEVRGYKMDINPTLDYKSTDEFHEQIGYTSQLSAWILRSIREDIEIVLINEQSISTINIIKNKIK